MRGPTLCSATRPQESRLLGTSRLGVHTSLGSSALRDSRILCATCIPLALRYGPHCSSCRDIAISQPRDPRGQILGPFLARSRDTIPRADPTVLLCSGSNGYPSLATSRPRDLEYPMFGLSTCELPSSRDPSISRHLSSSDGRLRSSRSFVASRPRASRLCTPNTWAFTLRTPEFARSPISATCPLRWTATNLSPLRRLASSRLATLNTQYLGFHSANSRVCEITDLCHLSSFRWTAPNISPLHHSRLGLLPNTSFNLLRTPELRDHRSLPPVLLRWMARLGSNGEISS
jgi:hypothetical protein